jgi:ATP-binding protein involved in chromosome partitioning
MFFSTKAPNESISRDIQQCLAEFFALPPEKVTSWYVLSAKALNITLPFATQTLHKLLKDTLAAKLAVHESRVKDIHIVTNIGAAPSAITPRAKIKNIIAVASGKGGVGKSTTSVNLAFALLAEGAKVGILDADIYGPSIPIMLGNVDAKPSSADQKQVDPIMAHGVVASSIGYFVPAENATVWRGPMASKALSQLLNETNWPELDYLIVDMPPGTGDIQLTLAQQIPVSGAIIVTTPQDLALADATKGIAMFNKVNVPVLGLVENMSYHICSQCGHHEAIFAEHGGEKLAAQYKLPLLAQLPLNIDIRVHADNGTPLQISQPTHPLTLAYQELAREVSKGLYLRGIQRLIFKEPV